MEFVNDLYRYSDSDSPLYLFCLHKLLLLMAPFAPFLSEELWHRGGGEGSIFLQAWPTYDEEALKEEEISVAIQVNGKLRSEIKVSPFIGEEELKRMVVSNQKVKRYIEGKKIARFIIIPQKLVNLVVK